MTIAMCKYNENLFCNPDLCKKTHLSWCSRCWKQGGLKIAPVEVK